MAGARWPRRRGVGLALILLLLVVSGWRGTEIQERGSPFDPPSWTSEVNVSHSAEDSRAPALAVDGEDTIHLVWEEGPFLYHSYGDGTSWSTPGFAATGEEPALAVGLDGTVHLAWSNEFGGNFEIYYSFWQGTQWSLPRNVSSTSGVSVSPALAVAPDGTRHVVWSDNSPGSPVIYHGWSSDGVLWSNFPIPSANGTAPAIAVGRDGLVHVAWQDLDSVTDRYEVYYSQWDGSTWSLPENISDSPEQDSTLLALAVADDNTVHLAWEEAESDYEVYYSSGHVGFWSLQENVSETPDDSYLPSLAIDDRGNLHLAWDEAGPASSILYREWQVSNSSWSATASIANNPSGVSDPALFPQGDRVIHSTWAEEVEEGNGDIFYSCRQLPPPHQIYLPLVMK
ncbi:MAG: sialidase family protein [Anaerolineae bacterium]